jgi:H+/Cl- antiporter ClcA
VQFEIKYLIAVLAAILIFGGLYFKFLYDVPDGEEITNMWVSWFLIIFGVIGITVSALWKKRNPLEVDSGDDVALDDSR